MWIVGAATHVDADDWSELSFVVVTVPVLSTTPLPPGQTPPVAAVVPEVTCTVKELVASAVPLGTVTPAAPPQFKTPAVIEQLPPSPPQPAPVWSIDHDKPGFDGNGSL